MNKYRNIDSKKEKKKWLDFRDVNSACAFAFANTFTLTLSINLIRIVPRPPLNFSDQSTDNACYYQV